MEVLDVLEGDEAGIKSASMMIKGANAYGMLKSENGEMCIRDRGCVGFMFTQKGVIVVDLEDADPYQLMMDALDAGAEDFDAGEEAAQVTTDPDNFTAVCNALEEKGYKFISADVAQVPSTTPALTLSLIHISSTAVRTASCTAM